MRRIGLLGGTFDPPHLGHIHLASELAKKHNLTEVWWIPTSQNPLKNKPQAAPFDRLAMVKLAIDKHLNFKVNEIEVHQKGPCFAIDTIREIKKGLNKEDQLFFLLGDDCLKSVKEWKDVLLVFTLAPPLIGARLYEKFPKELFLGSPLLEILKKGWTEIEKREISSTNLREKLKINHFSESEIPLKVVDYIRKNRLYS